MPLLARFPKAPEVRAFGTELLRTFATDRKGAIAVVGRKRAQEF